MKGQYFLTEDNDIYNRDCLWNYINGNYGLLKEPFKVKNAAHGKDYLAFHYIDGSVEIFTSYIKKYSPLKVSNVKKAVFTDTHIVLLHEDGTVSYNGQNKNKCCSGLDKYVDVLDIEGDDEHTKNFMKDAVAELPKLKAISH